MKKHGCKITTLKNQYSGKFQPPKKGCILFCQHISNLQYHDANGYYKEICNEGCRGAVNVVNGTTQIFDIAANPDNNPVKIKNGFLLLLKEKMLNDMVSYDLLIEEMLKDKKITEEEYKKMKIECCDFKEFLGVPENTTSFLHLSEESKKELFEKMKIERVKITF